MAIARTSINGVLVFSGTAAERATLAANTVGKGTEFWESDTKAKYRSDGTNWSQFEISGAALVNLSGAGPGGYSRTYFLNNVTGWETINLDAGINATYVSVTCLGYGIAAQVPANIAALVAFDQDNDAARDADLGATGDVAEGLETNGVDVVPLGQRLPFPLQSALNKGAYSGGRIDIRSLDGSPIMAVVKVTGG
jgi:hypothetical protein